MKEHETWCEKMIAKDNETPFEVDCDCQQFKEEMKDKPKSYDAVEETLLKFLPFKEKGRLAKLPTSFFIFIIILFAVLFAASYFAKQNPDGCSLFNTHIQDDTGNNIYSQRCLR